MPSIKLAAPAALILSLALVACSKQETPPAAPPPAANDKAEPAEGAPRIAIGNDGVHVQYHVYGQGEPALVFIHGWSCDSNYWREQVPQFKQNFRIDFPDGRWRYVDFFWPRLRAVLEIDSVEFHADAPDADATDDRHIELSTLGLSVVHRRPFVINHRPREFVAGIQAWLAGRARELGQPYP